MTNNTEFSSPLWVKKEPFVRLIQSLTAICAVLLMLLLCGSCSQDLENDTIPETQEQEVVHKTDGRTVRLGNTLPIALDMNEDGQVDFTVFIELMANSEGDHLFFGINPIGPNLIKSGPHIDHNFLNMGFLVAEESNAVISPTLEENQQWTIEHSALLVKRIYDNCQTVYEGEWVNGAQVVGVQLFKDQLYYMGWLKISLNKEGNEATLVEYAYQTVVGAPINVDIN